MTKQLTLHTREGKKTGSDKNKTEENKKNEMGLGRTDKRGRAGLESSLAAKSTCYLGRAQGFHSQNLYLSITLVPGNSVASFDITG